MALVTMKYELDRAVRGGYAVPAFNFFSVENLLGILDGARKKKSPLIAMASVSMANFYGMELTARITEAASEMYGIDVALFLDHAEEFDTVKKAIDSGFTSVMIDASTESFDENVKRTRSVVEYASKYGVTVEAELGHVGGKENDLKESDDISRFFTVPEDAKKFVEETGVDCLAIAVGTVHGFYKAKPKLDFGRIDKIHEIIPDIPLVLHGGTGIPDDDIRRAIGLGVKKVNIGTEFKSIGVFEVSKAAYAVAEKSDPRPISRMVIEKCAEIAENKIELMGSAGMA